MERSKWYKNAIIYQIYPFSFKDANNDGWGDIKGIVSKLDYFKKLGINAIWFSPLYKSPDKDYGYDISDYKDIDPKFGSIEDFKNMIKLLHDNNIRVIMDMAINHSSTDHEWFKNAINKPNSEYRNYYIIQKGKKKGKKLYPPTNWNSTFTGSAWENIKGTDDYYLHLFCKEQADLNWENPKIMKEAIDIFNYWMDLGVDGFRLDVFNVFSKTYPIKDGKFKLVGCGEEYYVDGPRMHEILQTLNKKSFSKYDSFTVGESYNPSKEDAKAYVDEKNHEIDTLFNFAHFNSDSIVKYLKKKFNLVEFKNGLLGPQIENYNHGWNTLVLENHDCSRSNSRFGINTKKYHYESSTFLPLITFLGFGIPFIYMGEEFGQTNVHFNNIDDAKDPVSHFIYNLLTKFLIPKKLAMKAINYGGRDNARVPLRWDDSINNGFNKGFKPWQDILEPLVDTNFKKDYASKKSIFKFYQKVIDIKKNNNIAIYGNIKEYDHTNKHIIAYSRFIDNDGLFIFGNFSNKTVKYIIPDEIISYQKELLLTNYESNIIKNNVYTLRPYEGIVLKIKK